MEASEHPATPDPAPVEGTPEAAPPPPPPAETQPDDVGEALQQMRQSIEDLSSRVAPAEQPAPEAGFADNLLAEYEDDYDYDEPQQAQQPQPQQPQPQQEPQLSDDELIERYIREQASAVAQQQVQEAFQRQTVAQRHAQIASLPERYPRMKEPEVVAQVAARLRGLAAEVGDSVWNSPAAVESAYQAYEAALRRDAEQSPEGESHMATLETGGGAAAPEPEQSPEEQAYAKVFERVEGSDPLTR